MSFRTPRPSLLKNVLGEKGLTEQIINMVKHKAEPEWLRQFCQVEPVAVIPKSQYCFVMNKLGLQSFDEIIAFDGAALPHGRLLGSSRDGLPIHGWRLGSGPWRISLIGGCHADEPTGPRFLRALVPALAALDPGNPMLTEYSWWILPHINPDGERRNQPWYTGHEDAYDLETYLEHAIRERPGDDLEFGFPRGSGDSAARPEAQAAFRWWLDSDPFHLHASLHGMSFAAGPWFLIESAWQDRSSELQERCRQKVADMGYVLHDVDRGGEKGFFRIGEGFSTRPDSRAMAAHFEALGDHDTAQLFRPSSMETIRSMGGDPLTIVSEMPLFIRSGTGNCQPMPVRDQMELQWEFISAAIEAVR